jgi:hypothetical protein
MIDTVSTLTGILNERAYDLAKMDEPPNMDNMREVGEFIDSLIEKGSAADEYLNNLHEGEEPDEDCTGRAGHIGNALAMIAGTYRIANNVEEGAATIAEVAAQPEGAFPGVIFAATHALMEMSEALVEVSGFMPEEVTDLLAQMCVMWDEKYHRLMEEAEQYGEESVSDERLSMFMAESVQVSLAMAAYAQAVTRTLKSAMPDAMEAAGV